MLDLAAAAPWLRPAELRSLHDFVGWLRSTYGPRVTEVCLFGSRARDEGNEESDLDVAVAIDGLTGPERQRITQRSGDALTQWDVVVSPFVLSAERLEELRALERRIALEITRDGISL